MVQRVVALPLVRTTCTAVLEAYSAAKDRHPLLGSACRLAEHCVCDLTARALDHAQPLLSHLQPQREHPPSPPPRPWVLPLISWTSTLSCLLVAPSFCVLTPSLVA